MEDPYKPPCAAAPELFFSPVEDGRQEVGRATREIICKAMCFRCEIRLECLDLAIQNNHVDGVWGGMGEGERRRFLIWLRRTYDYATELPQGRELHKRLQQFYQWRKKRREMAAEARRQRARAS